MATVDPRSEYFKTYRKQLAKAERDDKLDKDRKRFAFKSVSAWDWVHLPSDLSLDMRRDKVFNCEKILTVIKSLLREDSPWAWPSKEWLLQATQLKPTALSNSIDFLVQNRILQIRRVSWYQKSTRGICTAREFRLVDELSRFGTITGFPLKRVEMILQSPIAARFKDATKVLCMAYFISACSDGFNDKPTLKISPIEWCEKYEVTQGIQVERAVIETEGEMTLEEGERLNSRFSNFEFTGRQNVAPEGPLCGRGEMPMMLELGIGGSEGGIDEVEPVMVDWFESRPIGEVPQSIALEDLELKACPLNDFMPDFPTGFNDSNGGSGVNQGWPIGGLGGGTQGKVEQAAPKAQTGGSNGAPEAKATHKVVGFKIGDKAVAEDLQPQRSEAPYAWLGVDPTNEVQPKKDSLKAMKSALKTEVPQQQEVELEDSNDPDFSPTAHLDGLTTRLKHFADDPNTDPEWLADLNGLLDRIRKCPNLKPGANGLYPMGYRLDPRYAEDCRLLPLINQLPTKDKLKFPMVDKAVAVRLNNALFHLASSLQKGPPKIEIEGA